MTAKALWLAALGLVALGLSCYMGAVGRDAQTKAEIARLTRELAVERSKMPRTDTVYAKAKVVYLRHKARHDSLARNRPDSLIVPAPIKEILVEADSTIRSCGMSVWACEQRVAQRDTVIWGQDSLIAQLRKRKPFLLRIGKPLLPLLGGYIIGRTLPK